jgi:hypothetical protein
MIVARLIVHLLIAVALLGAVTHQVAALLAGASIGPRQFIGRYVAVRPERFARAIVVLYILVVGLGSTLYPSYRVDVRTEFEDMGLAWAVGLFELKEHAAAIGLGMLPLYAHLWRPQFADSHARDRLLISLFLAVVIWFDFLVGHVLNNIRGLS